MLPDLTIRAMTRQEANRLVDWAANEGWNPGLSDAALFWEAEPDAFIAAEIDGELIGGGTIASYGGHFGFMGFFIVRPDWRGQGLGDILWQNRRERLLARLKPGSAIGMDGVFTMQDYYAKGGFVFSHRNLRYEFLVPGDWPDRAPAADGIALVPLSELPLEAVLAYDRTCFAAPRPRFLADWIAQDGASAFGCLRAGELAGYGVIRRCRKGFKIGPLFADDEAVAETLFAALAARGRDEVVTLDVPETHLGAMALVKRHGLREVFGCARMYLGPPPKLAEKRIWGITTFELG
ncbi:GNAT family N-acetyltransferase [Novosphingobium profundi]|nr:GNAT family N-acetyltransferase [Novosphingobium profundi]